MVPEIDRLRMRVVVLSEQLRICRLALARVSAKLPSRGYASAKLRDADSNRPIPDVPGQTMLFDIS